MKKIIRKSKFSKSTTLAKIISSPKGESILHKHGVPCVTCPMAKMEIEKLQIGQVAKAYGLHLDRILKDLNKPGNIN